jgi:hypothetical protein
LLRHADQTAPLDAALGLAVEHARVDRDSARALVARWLPAPGVATGIALSLAARAGLTVSEAPLRAAAERLDPDDARPGVAFLRGLAAWQGGDAQRVDTPAMIAKFRHSTDDDVRRQWAHCLLAGAGDGARRSVLDWARRDPSVILEASSVAEGSERRELSLIARALSGARARLALGLLGDRRNVEPLLDDLRRDATGEAATRDAAARALRVLLGRAPVNVRLEPDEDEAAPPREVQRLSLEPEDWCAVAAGVVDRAPDDGGLRAGRTLDPDSTLELLSCLHLPVELRAALWRELTVRWRWPAAGVSERDLLARQLQRRDEAVRHFRSSPLAARDASPPRPIL